jgi:hypothetical protein
LGKTLINGDKSPGKGNDGKDSYVLDRDVDKSSGLEHFTLTADDSGRRM